MTERTRRPLSTGRSVDRLINFSDAVVAVAVTVLVLPLVDIEGPAEGQTAWDVLAAHASEITTFLFTFFVVAIMWIAHNRILNSIERYDGFIFWINNTWLVAIVLLPWVSSMYGEAQWGARGVGIVYWGTLAVISFMASLMAWHLRRRPELLSDDAVHLSAKAKRLVALRGPVLGGYFLLIGLTSLVAPAAASWMPFGIIALSIWLRPARDEPSEEA